MDPRWKLWRVACSPSALVLVLGETKLKLPEPDGEKLTELGVCQAQRIEYPPPPTASARAEEYAD